MNQKMKYSCLNWNFKNFNEKRNQKKYLGNVKQGMKKRRINEESRKRS